MIICWPQAGRYLRLHIRLKWYVGGSFEGEVSKIDAHYLHVNSVNSLWGFLREKCQKLMFTTFM